MNRSIWVIFLSLLALVSQTCLAQDSDGDGIPDSVETYLAEKFAPVLRITPGETFFPVAVLYALNSSELKLHNDGNYQLIEESPTAQSISIYASPDSEYFLDNAHGGIDDDGVKDHFESVKDELEPTVYARVTGDPSTKVVQYWFYYPFNEGALNRHEGDWEMIQIRLQGEEPVSASYSQHFSGQTADWGDVLLRDDHPIVYVARGSHANYFRSYQGVLGIQSDKVSALGPTIGPDGYQLVLLGEQDQHLAEQGWLAFSGRWGEWGKEEDQLRGRRGPPGPGHGDNAEKWENPGIWELSLPKLNTGWLWLSWLVANFAVMFGLYILIRGLWKFFHLGKAVWSRQALKGLGPGAALAVAGAILVVIAIWQPWYFVRLDVPEGEYRTVGEADMVILDGVKGLQINDPQSNRGLVTLFGLRMPIGLLLVSAFIFLILDTLKAKKPGDLRGPYTRSGIMNIIIPVLPILIFIAIMGSVVSGLVSSMVGEIPDSVECMIDSVSSNPIGGSYQGDVPDVGQANLRWGLGTGSLMIITGGVLKLTGGFISGKNTPAAADDAA